MKRPEGFDRPAEQPPATKPPRSSKPRVSDPVQTAGPTTPRREQPRPERPRAEKRRPIARESTGGDERRREKMEARARRRVERAEARRFTRHTRRRRFTLLGVAAVFVAMVVILAIAVFSPLLALRTIQVDGTNKVSASAVRDAVSGQLGTPLALLNDEKIHQELAQFTLIRSYATAIVPPNTLVIHIVEREAIGVLRHGKSYDQVDAAGVVLGTSPNPEGLPVIDIGNAKAGGAAFEAAVRVLLAMPTSVSHLVQTVSATTRDDVSLTLTGATNTVVWGSASQSDVKARVLAELLAQPTCKSQSVIDVSAPLTAGCGPAHLPPTPTPTSTSTSSG